MNSSSFLSRQVLPHDNDDQEDNTNNSSKWIEQLRCILQYNQEFVKDKKPYSDLAFGYPNPHDPSPLPGFVQALQDQIALLSSPAQQQQQQQQQHSFHNNDFLLEKQAIIESLQRRRGSSYDTITTDHIWITNGTISGCLMAMKCFISCNDNTDDSNTTTTTIVTTSPENIINLQGMLNIGLGKYCDNSINKVSVPPSSTPEEDNSNHFEFNIKDIVTTIRTTNARILLLSSPNNPTGQMYNAKMLQELTTELQKINMERQQEQEQEQEQPIVLISDETSHRIIFPSTHRSYVSPASFYEYTISIYDYTQTCMLSSSSFEPLGWLALSPLWPQDKLQITKKALDIVQIACGGCFSPSTTLTRCIPALERQQSLQSQSQRHPNHHHHHHHQQRRHATGGKHDDNNDNIIVDGACVNLQELEERRDILISTLSSHGIHNVFSHVVNPQSGFYILVRVPDTFYPRHDFEFVKLLAEKYRIVTIPGSCIGLPGWIRFSITASRIMIKHACAGIHSFVLDYESNDPALEPWLPKT